MRLEGCAQARFARTLPLFMGFAYKERKEQPMAEQKTDRINPIQVQKFLKGLKYPCKKADLVKIAKSHEADERIMGALQKLPDMEYARPTDVTREMGKLNK